MKPIVIILMLCVALVGIPETGLAGCGSCPGDHPKMTGTSQGKGCGPCPASGKDCQPCSPKEKVSLSEVCPAGGACEVKVTEPAKAARPEGTPPSLVQESEGLVNTPGLLALIKSRVPMAVFDARAPKWDDGNRIPGARWLSPTSTPAEIRKHVKSQDQLIVTYCAGFTCPASKQLSEHLKRLGYTNVLEYPEGIAGWAKAGLPVEKEKK
ncbi:MAG: rhodanese-like domain-containing protein [Candidatus Riflebacteria bacterium]|nr:rhodanese-like domain-containing protein [Candidatus Riflebacteria bacterium]